MLYYNNRLIVFCLLSLRARVCHCRHIRTFHVIIKTKRSINNGY